MKSVTYRTMSIVLKCAEDYCNPLEITSQRMALQMVFIISMLQMHLFWIWLSNRDRFFSENQSQILKQLLCGLLLHDQLNSLSACDSHPIVDCSWILAQTFHFFLSWKLLTLRPIYQEFWWTDGDHYWSLAHCYPHQYLSILSIPCLSQMIAIIEVGCSKGFANC